MIFNFGDRRGFEIDISEVVQVLDNLIVVNGGQPAVAGVEHVFCDELVQIWIKLDLLAKEDLEYLQVRDPLYFLIALFI